MYAQVSSRPAATTVNFGEIRADAQIRDSTTSQLGLREAKLDRHAHTTRSASWFGRKLSAMSEYSFNDRWRIDGAIEEVADLLLNTTTLSQWWPQISRIIVAENGGADGNSRCFAARTFGFMPYTLAVKFQVVEVRFPERFSVEISGDLQGHGGGILRQDGRTVAVDFQSTIRVARPALRALSLVARPAMFANHCWLMRKGEIGLQKVLDRRQAMGAAR